MASDPQGLCHDSFAFGDSSYHLYPQPIYGGDNFIANAYNEDLAAPTIPTLRTRLHPTAPDFIPPTHHSSSLSAAAAAFYPHGFNEAENNFSYDGYHPGYLTLPPFNPNAQPFTPETFHQNTSFESIPGPEFEDFGYSKPPSCVNPKTLLFNEPSHHHADYDLSGSTYIDDAGDHQQSYLAYQYENNNSSHALPENSFQGNDSTGSHHINSGNDTHDCNVNGGIHINDFSFNGDYSSIAGPENGNGIPKKIMGTPSNASLNLYGLDTPNNGYPDTILDAASNPQNASANGNATPTFQGNTQFIDTVNALSNAPFNPIINGGVPQMTNGRPMKKTTGASQAARRNEKPKAPVFPDHVPGSAQAELAEMRGRKRVREDTSDEEYIPSSNSHGKTPDKKKPGPKPGAKAKRQPPAEKPAPKVARQTAPRAAKKQKTGAQLETPASSPTLINWSFDQPGLADHEVCANCQWGDSTVGGKPMAQCVSPRHVGRGPMWVHVECAEKMGTITDYGPLCLGCVRLQIKPNNTAAGLGNVLNGSGNNRPLAMNTGIGITQPALPSPASTTHSTNSNNAPPRPAAKRKAKLDSRKKTATPPKEKQPSPLQGKPKSKPWSMEERFVAITQMDKILERKKHTRVDQVWKICSQQMWEQRKMVRTSSAVKNEWNRRLRAMCGLDERAKPRPDCLVTGALVKKTHKKIQHYKKARPLNHDAGTTEQSADVLCKDFKNFQVQNEVESTDNEQYEPITPVSQPGQPEFITI